MYNQNDTNQRKSRFGFLHRNRSNTSTNQHYDNTNVAPKQHTWTASATDAEIDNQMRNQASSSSTTGGHTRFGGLFGRNHQRGANINRSATYDQFDRNTTTSTSYGPNQNNWNNDYAYGTYGTSQSDWDHYAVRHEDSLIGDPIPYADDSMNGPAYGPYGYRNFGYGTGPNEYDATGLSATSAYVHNAPGRYPDVNNNTKNSKRQMNRWGPGPMVADLPVDRNGRPFTGNYSSGTVIENTGFPNRYGNLNGNNVNKLNTYNNEFNGPVGTGFVGEPVSSTSYGPNSQTTTTVYPPVVSSGDYYPEGNWNNGQPVTTSSVGPHSQTTTTVYPPTTTTGGRRSRWSSWFGNSAEPLYGHREVRETATPLLPDNPWTHNELSREYLDSRQTTNGLPANRRGNTAVYGPTPAYGGNYSTNTGYATNTTRSFSPAVGRNSPMVGRGVPTAPVPPPVYIPRSTLEPEHYRFKQGPVHVLRDDGYYGEQPFRQQQFVGEQYGQPTQSYGWYQKDESYYY